MGDSIAVNGVCLTVTKMGIKEFTADVMPETLRCTNLSSLTPGSPVNLERAMLLNGRFGGHIVSGHIDGTGIIKNIVREKNAVWIYIAAEKNILNLIVKKGSVAVDGVSLTVASLEKSQFAVSIIPHTQANTTLLTKKIGDRVNLENDMLAKYVERLIAVNKIAVQKKESENKMLEWLSEE